MGAAASNIVERKENSGASKNPNIDFLDEALLKKIATETGGLYFRAKDRAGLIDTYKQIDELEKSKIEISSFNKTEERFFPFLLASIVLLFVEVLLRLTIFKKFP
jgi:Ca-activated chloride channel family protein